MVTGRGILAISGFELVNDFQAFPLDSFDSKKANILLNSNLIRSLTELKSIWLLVVCRILLPFFARKSTLPCDTEQESTAGQLSQTES
ncbi:hypothetical protein TNCV_3069811 [Trichonephila clavipes]|nr:hypothetical protein TNCV_3069811 [Trichonephila clavipes]